MSLAAPARRPIEPAPLEAVLLEPALMLLRDLRELHWGASRNQMNWLVLAQAAKALHDSELQQLAEGCQAETERQLRWAKTLVKELSPQAVASLS